MFSNKNIFNLFCILFIIALIFASYSEVLNMYFVADEWSEFAVIESIRDTFYVDLGCGRPVRYALLDLIYSTFGLNPLPYHVVVLSLHAINSLLVLFIVGRITGDGIVGFLASCLFATFWMHAEALVCILQHDVLLATFSILCLISFYRYRVKPTRPSYILTLFFFILALGSKESGTLFLAPLLYLVDRYIVLKSEGASITPNLSWAAYAPFLLLAVFWACVTMMGSNVIEGFLKPSFSAARPLDNLVRSVTFCFSFPLFTESPRFGIINLILLIPLYFLSPLEIRSRVSLLMTSLVIICLPCALFMSPAPRHLYLSAVFSMAIFTVLFYCGVLQLSRKIRLTDNLCKFMVIACVSFLVYYSYNFVSKQVKVHVHVSKTYKNVFEAITASLPKGTRDIHIILINYPALGPEGIRYPCSFGLWSSSLDLPYTVLTAHKVKTGTISEFNLLELWDATSTFWKLPDRSILSPTEFEELTKREESKVFLFDPKLYSIHDVTGKDYAFLKELVGGN